MLSARLRHALAALTVASLLAVGLVAAPAVTGHETAAAASNADKIRSTIVVAKRQLGDRYRYGAAGPSAFDCSGLIYFAARKAGFSNIPRTSRDQSRWVKRIAKADMRRGDLVFFTGDQGVYHAGIYLGRKDGRRIILHSPSTGKRVSRAPMWNARWFAGTLRHR